VKLKERREALECTQQAVALLQTDLLPNSNCNNSDNSDNNNKQGGGGDNRRCNDGEDGGAAVAISFTLTQLRDEKKDWKMRQAAAEKVFNDEKLSRAKEKDAAHEKYEALVKSMSEADAERKVLEGHTKELQATVDEVRRQSVRVCVVACVLV
jgi:hypothetical protein